MFKLPRQINFLVIAIVSLSLTPIVPTSAAQESRNSERVRQSIAKEFAQNASAANYLRQGATLYEEKNFKGAEAAFRKAIGLDPNNAEVHNKLGNALANQGKRDEAIAEYRQAIRLAPNDARFHYNLGLALADQGKREQAIAEFKQAIRLAPNSAEAHAILGIALADQGELDEAVVVCQKAKDLFKAQGKTQEANQVEQLIQRMRRSIEKAKQPASKEFAQNANAADYLRQGITLLGLNDLRGQRQPFVKQLS